MMWPRSSISDRSCLERSGIAPIATEKNTAKITICRISFCAIASAIEVGIRCVRNFSIENADTGSPVEKFLTHLIPTSIADAMAQNEILQIVVFAVFFSVALGSMPERAKPILSMIDDLAHVMLKVTSYVMMFAPFAVWAAITATVAKNGLLVLWKLIVFMGGFY